MNPQHVSLPAQQRAWCWQKPGEPGDLVLTQLPLVQPGPGEILIANEYIGLNPVDWKLIEKHDQGWQPGQIPGVDGCGRLVARGEGVQLPLGARLAYHQAFVLHGSFAEYTRVRVDAAIPVPEAVSSEQAAAFPCPVLTAWQAISKLPAEADCDLLVSGAGGSVGLIMAQLAVARGWRVWATASPAHHEHLKKLGVIDVFDYHQSDWHERLQQALGPRRLWAICDTVNGAHAEALAHLLGYNGHLVCVQDRIEQAPVPAFSTAISLHEVALGSIHGNGSERDWRQWRSAACTLLQSVADRSLQLPPIQQKPFDQLPEALTLLKQGRQPGKWVIQL